MAEKSILLAVPDAHALLEIEKTLGEGWEPISVTSEADAMAQLEARTFDAVLIDFNLGSPDASQLLNRALEKRPQTLRFLLAYEADLALIAAKVLGSHQILPKPIEPASLKSRIEDSINEATGVESDSQPAIETAASPSIPKVYEEVLQALDSPDVTNERVGQIIAGDAALKGQLLRLTESAYMGLPRNVTDPVEAVDSLGLETVRVLVQALRFLAEHSRLKPCYLSVDQLWEHSINVGLIARDLVLFETRDRTLGSQALAAGLVHDLGKVVLATNFDDLYGRVHSLARKQPVALWDIEREMFGASHGEIGACLVGMWNLPGPIVEAAALHHEPPLGEHDQLTSLAAVHIANVIEHELRPTDEFRVAPIISTPFLNELGLLPRLPVWRARSAHLGHASQEETIESLDQQATQRSRLPGTEQKVPDATAATWTASSGYSGSVSRSSPRRWVFASVAAGVVLLGLWIRSELGLDDSLPVQARTPAISSQETTRPAPPEIAAATGASEPEIEMSPPSVPAPAISQAPPEPTPAPAPRPPVPSLTVRKTALPEFRVSGVICSVARPSAILNGRTVYVGDQVGGATVISIGRTNVVLQIRGQRRTYSFR